MARASSAIIEKKKKRGSRGLEFFIYMMYQFTDCLGLDNIASSSGHRVQVSSLLQ